MGLTGRSLARRAKIKGFKIKDKDLEKRTFEFAVTILDIIDQLPNSAGAKNVAFQLAKSGTSVGANYEESQASQSKEDFYYKIGICLREARESNYWLRIIERKNWINKKDFMKTMVQESFELTLIFGKIYSGRPQK